MSDWLGLVSEEQGCFCDALKGVYGGDPGVLAEKRALFSRGLDAFSRQYGAQSEAIVVRSAGRVNLMGMHTDHRGGYVNPIAVGEVVFIAQPRDDDRVVLRNVESERFPERSFVIRDELPRHKIDNWDKWTQAEVEKRKAAGTAGDWADYVRSSVLYLQNRYMNEDGSFGRALRGMNVMVLGNLPIAAGLSSSSSIVVAAAEAFIRINGLGLSDIEMVVACAEAEWYVGTRGGGGDHAAIKFGKLDHVTHIGSFPLSVDSIPLPPGYRIVLADSLKKAEKSAGARDVFNQRVACYIFGLMLIRKNFPQHAPRLEHLRDVSPRALATDDAEVYRILRSLPERATRDEIRAMLPDQKDRVEHVFGSHAEPEDGYRIRQVCFYGVSECLRGEMAFDMLKKGDVRDFGELMNISHDADRVTRLERGERVPHDNSYPDERMDSLIADVASKDPARRESARLWRQPGGYDASIEELDVLVDVARNTEGVVGAGLVGAGLGGCVVALVEETKARALIENFARDYYRPRNLEPAATLLRPVGGAAIIELQ